jgi:AcrR family transcriptional regulator
MARPTTHERVVAATLRCLAAQGLRRTTVEDVATEAGVSRATLYRAFPGGRETILAAVVAGELDRLVVAVEAAVARTGRLRDALVAGLSTAAAFVEGHAALERVMFDEPAAVLTHLEFAAMDRVLGTLSARVAPILSRWLGPTEADRAGEWAARVCVSYLTFPGDRLDLADPVALADLVDRHVLPGIEALAVRQPRETLSTNLS